ncbi:MAG: hypothetical protein ABI585_15630 [Betaproteobacteria bacterium]
MELTHIDIAASPDRPRTVRLTGFVRYDDPRGGPAEEAYWYEVPEAFASALTDSGNPWLVGLLPVAVAFGEPLVVSRPVDAELLDHVHELMGAWRRWLPGRMPVRIEAERANPRDIAPEAPSRTASYFSGGVDSFFTAMRPRADPVHDLLLFLGSFDLVGADTAALSRVERRMQAAADALGKTLVPVTTNQMATRLAQSDPRYLAGHSMLAAAALALERRYSRVLIPASVDLDWTDPLASEYAFNPLSSTSRMRFDTDGIMQSRVEKIAWMAGSDAARGALRVCFVSGGENNCMRCPKCIRTAVALEALGGLDRWPTFGSARLSASLVERTTVVHPQERYYFRELPPFCRAHGREDLARAVERVLARARLHDPFRPLVRWLRRIPAVAAMTHRAEAIVQDVHPLSLQRRRGPGS